jgi:hypothetical protein
MMLKEMQVLVAKERLAREDLQNEIEDLKKSHEKKPEDGSKRSSTGTCLRLAQTKPPSSNMLL